MRSIVCCTGTFLNGLSIWIDYWLQKLKPFIPSYLRNSKHLLELLADLGPLPPYAKLFTADTNSMYTNIETAHNFGRAKFQNTQIQFTRFQNTKIIPSCNSRWRLELVCATTMELVTMTTGVVSTTLMWLVRTPTMCIAIGVLGHWWRFQERRMTEDMESEEASFLDVGPCWSCRPQPQRCHQIQLDTGRCLLLSLDAGWQERHCIHFEKEQQGSL